MIAVASNALTKLLLIECGLVGTGLKQLSLASVTLAADIGYRSDPWRSRAMIAMTIVAGGRG